MSDKGPKGALPQGTIASISGVLKWSWLTAVVPLVINYFTTWKYFTLLLALILFLLTVSFRGFKWWVYRGTKQMGKRRDTRRSSLPSTFNPNQKKL